MRGERAGAADVTTRFAVRTAATLLCGVLAAGCGGGRGPFPGGGSGTPSAADQPPGEHGSGSSASSPVRTDPPPASGMEHMRQLVERAESAVGAADRDAAGGD